MEVPCPAGQCGPVQRKQGSPLPHRQNRALRDQAKKTRTTLSPLGGTGAGGAQLSSATGAAQGGGTWGAVPLPPLLYPSFSP